VGSPSRSRPPQPTEPPGRQQPSRKRRARPAAHPVGAYNRLGRGQAALATGGLQQADAWAWPIKVSKQVQANQLAIELSPTAWADRPATAGAAGLAIDAPPVAARAREANPLLNAPEESHSPGLIHRRRRATPFAARLQGQVQPEVEIGV